MKNKCAASLALNLVHQYLFWLVVFFFVRCIFLFYHFYKVSEESLFHIARAFYEGLYIDLSAASYIVSVSFLLTLFYSVSNINFFNKLNFYYASAMLFLVMIISVSELNIYKEWGIKLHYKALKYLQHPSEVIQTAGTKTLLISALAILIFSMTGIFFFRKYIHINSLKVEKPLASFFILFFTFPPLLVLSIRGGWQQIPIQLSDVYYSHNNTLNNTAVNSLWNIGHSIRENLSYLNHNPYTVSTPVRAKSLVDSLFHSDKDSVQTVLTHPKPNIVLFILEGWSADLIASLNGYHGVTPHFDSLAKKGILFSNIYASGDRSDQGMAAILSAFPAQPTTSIISQPSKYKELPCLGKTLKKAGYSTSFIFGGQLTYGNIKSFIVYNHFDYLMEGKDFNPSLSTSKLGVPDEFVYKEKINITNKLSEPFFSVSFNLSSHAPYDIPRPYIHHWGGNENGYVNSVWYADSCLGVFMNEAKKQKWYNQTLFVFIPDHSHNSPKNHPFYSPAYRKIPMLFYGNVLDSLYIGKNVTHIGSQTDLAATLLSQLKIHFSEYTFSKNLFNPTSKEFAYYAIVDGVGWVKPEGFFVYDYPLNRYYELNINNEDQKTQFINEGKYFLQHVFQTYLEY